MFDAIAFAGGGNRCYWQGGFYEAAADRLGLAPKLVAAASAGAFAACYSLLGIGPSVRALVIGGCGGHLKNFDVAAWRRGEPLCPVGPLYRKLLDTTIDEAALARLNALTDLRLAISRLPRGLSPIAGAALGIAAYQLEKKLLHPVHPRFGRRLGYQSEFVLVRADGRAGTAADGADGVERRAALHAGDTGRRKTRLRRRAGRQRAGRTARRDRSRGRTHAGAAHAHLQADPVRSLAEPTCSRPQKIGIGQFDITNPDGIRAAYELGLKDGDAFASAMGK